GESDETGKDEKDNGGPSSGSEGGNKGHNNAKADRTLCVSSSATAEAEDFQTFSIDAEIWANVSPDTKYTSEKTLEFWVDLYICGVGELLSERCPSLRGFVGYYLDSVAIMVSPIGFDSKDRSIFTVKKPYSPQVE